MTQSMTGYTRTARRGAGGNLIVEIRSTNHRYLEIGQRLPEGFAALEGPAAELIREHVRRGRIEVNVTRQAEQRGPKRVRLNVPLARAYYQELRQLKTQLGLKSDVTLEQVLGLPQVVSIDEEQRVPRGEWPELRQVLQAALRDLLSMRRAEGARLARDLTRQIRAIRQRLAAIQRRLPKAFAEQRRRFRQRLEAVVGKEPGALAPHVQEAVSSVKETDIHEELVRLASHLRHVEQALSSDQPVGKKLDFIAQELMREANTMGAKANDEAIVRWVIEIRGVIEKIREQVQNLE